MTKGSEQFEMGPLRKEELNAWYELCGRIFEGVDAAYFRAHFENDPDACCEDIFVARKDGELVSSVRLFTRSVFVRGRIARVGGIGEVCTDPNARGYGLSTKLLTLAMEAMDARGWELGMLYGVLQSHYGRQGFANAPVYYKRAKEASLPSLQSGDRVRPFDRADLNAIMGIYDLYTSQFDFAYRREKRAYWEKWVLHEWKQPMVLVREGRILAYADVSAREECMRVREAGALPGEEDALAALLGACAKSLGCKMLTLPQAVLPQIAAEKTQEHSHLMLRMPKPVLGFGTREELLDSIGENSVQWDTDDY